MYGADVRELDSETPIRYNYSEEELARFIADLPAYEAEYQAKRG